MTFVYSQTCQRLSFGEGAEAQGDTGGVGYQTMKYLAVIFDLFGTLVGNFSSQGYMESLSQMASVLSLPFDDFRQVWFATSTGERNIGVSQSCEGDVENVCRKLEIIPEDRQVQLAVQHRLDYIRNVMTPQPNAIEVLSCLKD